MLIESRFSLSSSANSKKKQKTGKGSKKSDKKPTYNVQLLLNLPFDLFAEVSGSPIRFPPD